MIEINGVAKRLGDKDVLRDINLEVWNGELFAIIGASGSGKTVLLKHLIGLMKPDRGRILIDGADITRLAPGDLQDVRRRFGVLFQNGVLFDNMTVFQNTAFPLRMLTDATDSVIRRRVHEALEMVELPGIGARRPRQLSGAQRRRVALARAIVLQPDYLFYDEPDTELDPEASNTIDDLIARLTRELSITSVIVTHNIHSVFSVADRAAFLDKGEMRFVGTIAEMRACKDDRLCAFMKANEYQV